MSRHAATTSGGPAGMPSPHGEEHTSIGNDPLAGSTTEHDVGVSPDAPDTEREAGRARQRLWQTPAGPGPAIVGADAFDGQQVFDRAGDEVGRVEKVVMDLACGRLAYVVIELTAFAGGRLCAVPWPAFQVDPRTSRLSIAFTPDDLHQAPTFDRGRWPQMSDERWAEEVHAFFGCRPYWV